MVGEAVVPGEGSGGRRSVYWYAAGALAITLFGVIASAAFSIPGLLIGLDTPPGFVLAVILSEAGFGVAAVIFVYITGRNTRYFDLGLPDSWLLVGGVTIGTFIFRNLVLGLAVILGINPPAPAIIEAGLPIETLLVIMIPISILVIGPAEELLFRGAIQKYLGERVPPRNAILGAGVLFALIHLFTFTTSTGIGAFVSIFVIFIVGLALGWLYERTGSVVSAMAAHAGYNALIFGTGYVATQFV